MWILRLLSTHAYIRCYGFYTDEQINESSSLEASRFYQNTLPIVQPTKAESGQGTLFLGVRDYVRQSHSFLSLSNERDRDVDNF